MCHVGRGSDEGLTLVLRIDELALLSRLQVPSSFLCHVISFFVGPHRERFKGRTQG